MEHFWAVQAYGVAQAAEYSTGVLSDVGLLVGCGCLTLMCTFLGEPRGSLFQKLPAPHLAQSTVKESTFGFEIFGLSMHVLSF